MDNETISNVEKVEEAAGVKVEEAPDANIAEPQELKEEIAQTEEAVTEGIDRSAYNCPDCAGEGLKSQTEVCPRCQGTGKVG